VLPRGFARAEEVPVVQVAPLLVSLALALHSVPVASGPLADGGHPQGLVGCYELARLHDGSAVTSDGGRLEYGRWFGGVERIRCFAMNARFLEHRIVTFASPAGSAIRESWHEGSWSTRGRRLTVSYADGGSSEWELEPFDGGVQLGPELWRRLDLEPETLWAEVEDDAEDEEDEEYEEDGNDPGGADDGDDAE
jgi:hypothetical protein